MLFQLLENLYFRWKELRNRPKELFWPHEHLEWIIRISNRVKE